MYDFLFQLKATAIDAELASAMEKEYADIFWTKETLWDDMLVYFFKKSESVAIAEDLEKKSTVLLRSFLQGVNGSNFPLSPGDSGSREIPGFL